MRLVIKKQSVVSYNLHDISEMPRVLERSVVSISDIDISTVPNASDKQIIRNALDHLSDRVEAMRLI
jgi:hypothetical protein